MTETGAGSLNSRVLPIVMCGGSGTRMWPESRESLPKQFITLFGDRSTFQMLMVRLTDEAVFHKPVVITNADYRFRVAEQLSEIGVEAEIVLEPIRRDSGAAVAVATELALQRAPQTVVAVLAADHVIADGKRFVALCAEAGAAAASGAIVTFGITPTFPATGYGYISPGKALDARGVCMRIERFVEKPDAATAQTYLDQNYLWNSGNFVFRADVMSGEIKRFEPLIAQAAAAAVAKAKRDLDFLVLDEASLGAAPKKSIDYAVMEKTDKAAVIPADMGWSDIGTWSSVYDLSEQDADGNSVRGEGVVYGATNTYIRSDGILTAVVGVSDAIVVSTGDAVLVVARDKADQVKQLVEHLKAQKRREAVEHRRMYRPWGYYQSIDNGARYQVKRIVVTPGGRLSLQKHFHRAEHWIVVRGTAEVTVNDKVTIMAENESIYMPLGSIHRLANPGKIDLELIEVQTGSYLGEDDIQRFEDVYNRS